MADVIANDNSTEIEGNFRVLHIYDIKDSQLDNVKRKLAATFSSDCVLTDAEVDKIISSSILDQQDIESMNINENWPLRSSTYIHRTVYIYYFCISVHYI